MKWLLVLLMISLGSCTSTKIGCPGKYETSMLKSKPSRKYKNNKYWLNDRKQVETNYRNKKK
jgi:hypothetical protein